jgi:hypothetical protein
VSLRILIMREGRFFRRLESDVPFEETDDGCLSAAWPNFKKRELSVRGFTGMKHTLLVEAKYISIYTYPMVLPKPQTGPFRSILPH